MGGVADALRTGRDFVFGTPSEQSSNPVVDPALLSPENINAVIQQIMAMSSGPSTGAPTVGPAATPGRVGPAANPASLPVGIEQSPFFQLFRSAMTDRFTPTAPENQLLLISWTKRRLSLQGVAWEPLPLRLLPQRRRSRRPCWLFASSISGIWGGPWIELWRDSSWD